MLSGSLGNQSIQFYNTNKNIVRYIFVYDM